MKKAWKVSAIMLFLLLSLLINSEIIVATQQEGFFSWSGTLSWLSGNKKWFPKYLKTSQKVRLVLSAPETLKVYIQSSDDFDKSGLSGWLAIYSHWNAETAELDYTFTVPFTDTWYFTVWDSKTHDVYVNSFKGYIVTSSPSPPPENGTSPIPPIWLIVIGGTLGAIIASGIITCYLLKIRKKR